MRVFLSTFSFFFSHIMLIVTKMSSTWYDLIRYWLVLKAVLHVCTPWWSNAGTKFPVVGLNSPKFILVWFSGVIRAVAVTKQIRHNCHITCYISRIFIISCIAIQASRIMSSINCEQRSYYWSLEIAIPLMKVPFYSFLPNQILTYFYLQVYKR